MRTPLAWLNLLHNKVRTLIAVAGVGFAVVLIFMQMGFYGSVESTATIVYGSLDFDVVIRSKEYLHVSMTRSFPRDYLSVARSVPGVAEVNSLYLTQTLWRNPYDGKSRGILVIGIDPKERVFRIPEVLAKQDRLTLSQNVLIDRKSRKEFGPKDGIAFSDEHDDGAPAALTDQPVTIVGTFNLGGGLANDGTVITSDRGFARVAPDRTISDVSLALINVKPGEDPYAVRDRIRAKLGQNGRDIDVIVLTRDEAIAKEKDRWVGETSLGTIFTLGVVLAMFVGTAIVYQVLSTDVANHIAEYATLKAMGYSDVYLAGVVLSQAVILAVVGFVPGLAVAQVLYWFTEFNARIPMEINALRIANVLMLTIAMCVMSGLGALRKVRSLDPADLF